MHASDAAHPLTLPRAAAAAAGSPAPAGAGKSAGRTPRDECPLIEPGPALTSGPPGTAKRSARIFSIVVILATLLPLTLGLAIGRFAPRLPSLDWTMVIDQRVRRYADSIQTRKVIFVGGSNLRFGLDEQSLSEKLGVPVVNYGLHASLGIDLI